jgi:serine/threonine-protein kinase
MLGSLLGSWRLVRELGRGGMGTVYLAHRESSPDEVAAVKVLAAELATESGFLLRFQREIDILRKLDYRNIVHFLDSGEDQGRYFFSMEYVDGPSLQSIVEERGKLPWKEVVDLAAQIAPALKHAHDRGVIHRDIKPSNLLREVASDGPHPYLYKLTDFGIASVFAAAHLTVTGGVVGTAEYLSPEQAAGKPVSPRSDLYSFGIVLYALLTGRVPFSGEQMDLLHKHLYAQFEHPCRLVPEIPRQLGDLVCEMLEKDPARRPPDGHVLFRKMDAIRRRHEVKESLAAQEKNELAERATSTDDDDSTRVGPATLMSRLMREELDQENRGSSLWRFIHHPAVLILLFAACVGVIVWTFWPLSPEGLYRRGAALMASEDPADWEYAWEEYLQPLQTKYPDHPHQEELGAFREKLRTYESEKEARRETRQARAMSEPEWFYHLALRLRQTGQEEEAREVWRQLVAAWQDVPSQAPWVRLARERLDEPADKIATPRDLEPVDQALDLADNHRQEGNPEKADAILNALRGLYRNEPSPSRRLTVP